MRMHFFNRHVRDIVIILEEGNLPHPLCPQCDMLVPWRSLNGRHHTTAQCEKGAEQKRRWMAEAELRDSTEDLRGLWEAAGDCVGFQVPGTGDDGGRQRLASSGGQPI